MDAFARCLLRQGNRPSGAGYPAAGPQIWGARTCQLPGPWTPWQRGPDHIELADILRAYRTVPHVDHERTDAEAARALVRRIALGNKVKPVYVRVPVLVAGERSVDSQGAHGFHLPKVGGAGQTGRHPDVLLHGGFCMGDTPNSTAAVAITPETEADRALCEAEAEKLGIMWWSTVMSSPSPCPLWMWDETVEAALNSDAKPLYIPRLRRQHTTCGATGQYHPYCWRNSSIRTSRAREGAHCGRLRRRRHA